MNEPLVIAAIISMIGLTLTAVITGIFACFKAKSGSKDCGTIPNGLLAALRAQTDALADLTLVLRASHHDDQRAHEKMVEALTVLVERTKGCGEDG
jgi:hypothetical protein